MQSAKVVVSFASYNFIACSTKVTGRPCHWSMMQITLLHFFCTQHQKTWANSP